MNKGNIAIILSELRQCAAVFEGQSDYWQAAGRDDAARLARGRAERINLILARMPQGGAVKARQRVDGFWQASYSRSAGRPLTRLMDASGQPQTFPSELAALYAAGDALSGV